MKEEYIKKIKEYQIAIQKSNSKYLKRDYEKAIKKLKRKIYNGEEK